MLPATSLRVARSHRGHLTSQIPHRRPGPETYHVRRKCVYLAVIYIYNIHYI